MTASLVEVGGLPTWYAEYGDGDPLVYLHGGFSSSRELAPVGREHAEPLGVRVAHRRGHGRTPDVAGPFTYERYAEDAVAFLDEVVGGPAHLVGYSDGAITALLAALARPDLVRRMVLISGQYHQSGLLPAFFHGPDAVAELQATPLATWYAEESPDGGEHFPVVAAKIIENALTGPTLTADQLAAVPARTLVMSGDDDAITLEHTIEMYRSLPEAELAVVPGTSHLLCMEKPALVTQLVLDFLTTDPVPTFAPIRRA
jgi:pimeloyl-ACP methyl ester carboxylesterase